MNLKPHNISSNNECYSQNQSSSSLRQKNRVNFPIGICQTKNIQRFNTVETNTHIHTNSGQNKKIYNSLFFDLDVRLVHEFMFNRLQVFTVYGVVSV